MIRRFCFKNLINLATPCLFSVNIKLWETKNIGNSPANIERRKFLLLYHIRSHD